MCWFDPLSPGAAGEGEAEGSPHPSGCSWNPCPCQGLPWQTLESPWPWAGAPHTRGVLSPQPCPTFPLEAAGFWPSPARESKAFFFPLLLLLLHFDGAGDLSEEDALPFLSIRSTHAAPRLSPTPALLSSQLPLAAARRQRCASSLICLAAPTGGLAPGLITHSPAAAVARSRSAGEGAVPSPPQLQTSRGQEGREGTTETPFDMTNGLLAWLSGSCFVCLTGV